jgi:ESF2/ABP1 family protein
LISYLNEFAAHEAAQRSAQLRVELAQSRTDQRDYLKNVELARVLTKRAKRKEESEQKVDASDSKAFQPSLQEKPVLKKRIREGGDDGKTMKKTRIAPAPSTSRLDDRTTLDSVLSSIF